MERTAWKAKVKVGCGAEYVKRHNEFWPEMKEVLKTAGICNYTIFLGGNELFGYFECEKGLEYSEQVQSESDVIKKWNEYMSDILETEIDPSTGEEVKLIPVFRLD